MRRKVLEELKEKLKDKKNRSLENLKKAADVGIDISFAYSAVLRKLSSTDYNTAFEARSILEKAALKDPYVIEILANKLKSRKSQIREHSIYALDSLSEKSVNIEPALPNVAGALSDKESTIVLFAAKILSRKLIAENKWAEIDNMLRSNSSYIVMGTLRSLKTASENNIDIVQSFSSVLDLLIKSYEGYQEKIIHRLAEAVIENVAKSGKYNISKILDDIYGSKKKYNDDVRNLVVFLVDIARCEICGKIPGELSINVDDELPSPVKRLKGILYQRASCPGMYGYGFYKCPLCGCHYYNETQWSLTGSGTNDYDCFYRYLPAEMELMKPLFSMIENTTDKREIDEIEIGMLKPDVSVIIQSIKKLYKNKPGNSIVKELEKNLAGIISAGYGKGILYQGIWGNCKKLL